MKFPRIVHLDRSDFEVFAPAARPGELAVPGSFEFADRDPDSLDRKRRIAYRSAWLGTETFGRATLVEVAEIDEAAFFQVIERLARHFIERYGAPDLGSALPAARQEADYAQSLCDHKINTLLAMEREPGEAGTIERIRVIRPERAGDHAKIWDIVEEDDPGPDGP